MELSDRSVFGIDWKERTSQACKMNMQVHGDGSSGIFMAHGFVDIPGKIEEGYFNISITNPPFGSTENDGKILEHYELGAGRKSQDRVILAIERTLRLVKPSGWVGIVVIDGVLNNDSTRYVREYIRRNAWVKGIVSLNSETFEGYGARAKTSILLLQKKTAPDEGAQEPVFMAVAQNTGYAPNGAQIAGNELPDILMAYRSFLKGEKVKSETPACWVTSLEDRLDTEFYWVRADGAIRDVTTIQKNVGQLLAEVSAEYAGLERDIQLSQQGVCFNPIRLGDVLEEVQDRERVDPDKSYRLLGVRWWGGGAFIREEKLGREIKGANLWKVSKGQIIYNRLFAFRGSFAVVGQEHDGCHASGEFPTFRMKDGQTAPDVKAQFIVHCLNSPNYLSIVDKVSTGSTKTSRNRFKEDRFLNMVVQIPDCDQVTAALVTMLDRADNLRAQQQTLLERVKELRDGIGRMLPSPKN
jgi:type I restriction enzyme M protein